MQNSMTVTQELAAELGLPEAKGAPAGSSFSVARLLELQKEALRRREEARKARALRGVQPTFMPPQQLGCRTVGFVRKDF